MLTLKIKLINLNQKYVKNITKFQNIVIFFTYTYLFKIRNLLRHQGTIIFLFFFYLS